METPLLSHHTVQKLQYTIILSPTIKGGRPIINIVIHIQMLMFVENIAFYFTTFPLKVLFKNKSPIPSSFH